MEEILLSDVVFSGLSWLRAITTETSEGEEQEKEVTPDKLREEFDNVLHRIIIRSRLPLGNKRMALTNVLFYIQALEKDAIEFSIGEEAARVLYGLILPYTNIKNDLSSMALQESFIDAYYDIGLVDYILQYCEDDYLRLQSMIDSTLNWRNILDLFETMNEMDLSKVDELNETIKEYKKNMTPEMVHDMATITTNDMSNNFSESFKNSLLLKFKDEISKSANIKKKNENVKETEKINDKSNILTEKNIAKIDDQESQKIKAQKEEENKEATLEVRQDALTEFNNLINKKKSNISFNVKTNK